MPFLTESEPPRGVATEMLPGIRRLVARNASLMTYHGTNSYLLESDGGLTVIDPGPRDPQHVADLLHAAGGVPITRIVLTHSHIDHYGAVPALREQTGATVYAYKTPYRKGFTPDVALDDGESVAGLTAIFTPGHAADHLSFAYDAAPGKILFSGDHVMSWSSSIVNPPEGDMVAYYKSLHLLLDRPDALYLSAHGPLLADPRGLVAELLAHRQKREATILAQLREQPWTVGDLAGVLYAKTHPYLQIAAERNVLAHFLKLQAERVVAEENPPADLPDDLGPETEARRDALRRFALA